jgi:hypothetical protein
VRLEDRRPLRPLEERPVGMTNELIVNPGRGLPETVTGVAGTVGVPEGVTIGGVVIGVVTTGVWVGAGVGVGEGVGVGTEGGPEPPPFGP